MNILWWFGIDLSTNEETVLYRIFSFISMTSLLTMTFLELCELIGQWGNLNDICNVLIYLITHITGIGRCFLIAGVYKHLSLGLDIFNWEIQTQEIDLTLKQVHAKRCCCSRIARKLEPWWLAYSNRHFLRTNQEGAQRKEN